MVCFGATLTGPTLRKVVHRKGSATADLNGNSERNGKGSATADLNGPRDRGLLAHTCDCFNS